MKVTTMLAVLALLFVAPLHGAVLPVDGIELLIPVAGYAPGAAGELFSTDLTLVNLSRAKQSVRLTWLPGGGTASPVTRTINLEALAVQPLTHVLRQVFGRDGIGAILISAFDPATPIPAVLDANARIWTETICAGRTGTVSQSVPAIRLDNTWRDASPAYVHGVRQSPGFRTNYGIVNMSSRPLDFRVLVNSAGGRVEERVTVQPNGTVHRPVPAGVDGELSVFIEPLVPAGGQSGSWRGYAATTDNQTGSGWTVVAMQPRTDVQF